MQEALQELNLTNPAVQTRTPRPALARCMQQDGVLVAEKEYSTTEASELLGLKSRTTLWEAINKGELQAREYGKRGIYKIKHSELVRYARLHNYNIPPDPPES